MMNTVQRKYALERVSAILSRKVREITDKYTTPAASATEVAAAFKKGKVALKQFDSIGRYRYLEDIFDLSAFNAKINTEAVSKETMKVEAEADRIRDQIMLGDAEEALTLLQTFEK